jgi:hypothetical protein
MVAEAYQSSTELVELRVKLGGPPSKAKYYSTTDSEPVRRLKDEKHPDKGSEKHLKPYAYKLWEPVARRVTACLLHNEPTSCSLWQG